jgi:hypothetical protein
MRASAANRRMEVDVLIGDGARGLDFVNRATTLTVPTTMTSFEIDVIKVVRVLDDLSLVP